MTGIRGTDAMDTPLARPSSWGGRRRLLLAAAVVVLVAGGLGAPAALRWAQADRSVDRARLQLATVERGDLTRDAAVQGRVVAANFPRLYSPARGRVGLIVRPGDLVRRGQVLARVDSPELAAELEGQRSLLTSLESELGRLRIALRQRAMESAQEVERLAVAAAAAERELGRARALRDEGLLNLVELDRAQDDVALSRLTLEQARQAADFGEEAREFELADAAARVERQRLAVVELERRVAGLVLTSPFDGLVGSVEVEDRDAVAESQPLLTVVDLSEYEVEVGIPEVYADDVAAGTPAVVLYDTRRHPAAVTAVSPAVDGGQVEGRVAFTGAPPAGLRQNQRVSVRLVFERRRDVLKVPRGPFYESGGGRTAYVLADGLAVRRSIETGAVSVSEVEVLGGLAEGDQVVLNDVGAFGGAERVLVRP
jgi:HlyD family secretion protein